MLLAIQAGFYSTSAIASSSEFQQRNAYLNARALLRQGALKEFRAAATELDDYVLRPYLDYDYVRNRLSNLPPREVLRFLEKNPELPVTPLLRKRWLRELGRSRQWQTLRKHYQPTTDAEIHCYYLRALYGTGDQASALDQTTAVWLQPSSQPKSCDPLFEVWRQTPRFTQVVVWQRFSAALEADEPTLARYLIRYLSGDNKTLAETFHQVHTRPDRITRSSQYQTDNDVMRTIIAHGITRLARRDSTKAAKAWRQYRKTHAFDSTTAARLDGIVAVAQAEEESLFPDSELRTRLTQPDGLEALANAGVKAQEWREARYWIEQLPADIKQKAQWRYWLARSHEALDGPTEVSDHHYRTLAAERQYYGFLASRRLGLPGQMNAQPGNPLTAVDLLQARRHPGITRSIELFAVNDEINGRREWYHALQTMTPEQQVLCAELAQHLGLIRLAIRTANIAEANDHLHLRFPVAYEPQFRQAGMKTNVEVPLLMAIARQESALEAQARSSADARGLMQLLPSTARVVARRAGQRTPETSDLYDPGTNIALGSYHLAWLLERYDGQTPLAIAAYNAGEHRVDRWIRQADGLPMDVWIERIPFRETRNYVKNVLAFRHVYGHELDLPTPILNPQEQQVGAR
jgi:soluble lytic murein transglycosylase